MRSNLRQVLEVFQAAHRYSRALESRERTDRKAGMVIYVTIVVILAVLIFLGTRNAHACAYQLPLAAYHLQGQASNHTDLFLCSCPRLLGSEAALDRLAKYPQGS